MAVRPQRQRSSRSGLTYPLLVLLTVILAGIGYVFVLGEVDIPGIGRLTVRAAENDGPGPLPEGMVRVVVNPRPLPAYTRITRDHLLLDAKGGRSTVVVRETAAQQSKLFTDDNAGISRLLGRVLSRNKPANFPFSENDLLPQRTREGLAGGIPPGMRGLWVESSMVNGLADLRIGDRFDIVASGKASSDRRQMDAVQSVMGGALASELVNAMNSSGSGGRSWTVAHNGVVVQPMRLRQKPISNASAFQGVQIQTVPIQEVFIAVRPQELAALSQAFATDATLYCAPRSGRPEDDVESVTPDVEPPNPLADLFGGGDSDGLGLSMVEVVRGEQRTSLPVRKAAAEAKPGEGQGSDVLKKPAGAKTKESGGN